MKISKWLFALVMAATVALAGCGGSSSSDDTVVVPPVEPASVVGAWNAVSFYVPSTDTLYPNGEMFSGVYTFNADGTYTSTIQVNHNAVVGGTWWIDGDKFITWPTGRPGVEEHTYSVTATTLVMVLLNQTTDGTLTFTFSRL